MKKQYTKKQIQEAIKYWTRRLKALDESKIQVIDDLIDVFGETVVLNKSKDFTPNTYELRQIYDILNARLFNNQLKNIPVTAEHDQNIADRLNIYNEVSHSNESRIENCNAYAVHLAAINELKASNGKTEKINIFDNIIMLNRDLLIPGIFIFIVASLCHEMIHYYDSFSDEVQTHVLNLANDPNYEYDSHNNQCFKEKLKEANNNGIRVTNAVQSGDDYRAYIKVKNILGEDEEFTDTKIRQDHGHIYVVNRRTGRGFYADYD